MMQTMTSWDDVHLFLAIYRGGSLSAAGRALAINQSTVGRRLKTLERAVGAKLLRLTATGAALTEAGTTMLPEAEQMEIAMLALERKVSGRDAKLEGTVRIATTEALASTFLIPRLARLRAQRPELDFTVVTSNLPSALARGEADLALRLVKPEGEGLVIRRVGSIELGMFAAHSYLAARGTPKLDRSLAGHDVLGYHSELANGTEARWLAAHAPLARMVLRVNSVLNLLAATLAGMGIAALPLGLGDDPALQQLALGKPPEGRNVWVVFHEDARANAKIKAVVDDLVAHAKEPRSFPRSR
jgi:DNA-binding transcriptional LysR family regulator